MVLQSVLLLELNVLLPEGVDSVNHDLDQLNLGVSETVLVGDVISVSSLTARFSAGSTGLNSEFLASCLELVNSLLGVSGKINVDGSSHASSKIGWAGVDVSVLLGEGIVLARLGLDGIANSLDSTGKTSEDSLDVSSLFHGDDTGLILLIDPHKEGLGVIVEDSTALGPVTLHTSNCQVSVSADKEEVVIDELLSDGLIHTSEWVVLASKISIESLKGRGHHLLNVNSLLLGDSGGETESINVASNTDTGGVDGHLRVDVAINLGGIHVRGVLGISGDTMVLLNQRVKDNSEVLVRVPVTSVDAAVLVVELNSASDGLGKGESGGLGDNATKLVPLLLGDVLGSQGVGGLDVGEFAGHIFACLYVLS